MLTRGKKPVIQNHYSLQFIKALVYVFTKVLLHAYLSSMAIRSLTYYWVSFDSSNSDLYNEVLNLYYRGINDESAYRGTNGKSEIITFTTAALVLPLAIFAFLYLPTVLFLAFLTIKNYHKKLWVIDIAVNFMFAIFTNMWLNDTGQNQSNKARKATARSKFRRSHSEANMELNKPNKMAKPRSKSLPDINLSFYIDPSENHRTFSLYHSNILFLLFFFGSSLVLMADIALQRVRPSSYQNDSFLDVSPTMRTVIGVYFMNLFLWLDFNYTFNYNVVKAQRRQACGNER